MGAPTASGWALTITLTSEATSPLAEPAGTASGSHVAKDDRNAVLDGPGKRESPSCSPDSFALKDISPGRWTSSGQPELRPGSRVRAGANASTQRWVRQAWRITQVQALLYQLGKTEVQGQGGWEEQAGIVHQAVIVEGDLDAVEVVAW